jgi:translation initiation factor eIF-2B subunit alpha
MKTHQILTAKGVPCTVVLDSAVGYIMERVDLVLVGSEAVVESGVSLARTPWSIADPQALVSAVGTYQVALVAKAFQKPFYALAESYKFLRHFPLSQTDLPMPRHPDSTIPEPPLTFPSHSNPALAGELKTDSRGRPELGEDMERRNPTVDVTAPNLIDFIITDLGAPLSPASVSQYLVAQFSS